jgi:hypothetical protein
MLTPIYSATLLHVSALKGLPQGLPIQFVNWINKIVSRREYLEDLQRLATYFADVDHEIYQYSMRINS